MVRITDVVKHLIIINVLLFFGSRLILGDNYRMLALYYPSSEYHQPFQYITHMFMHADISHLFFNMLTLFFLGPTIEAAMGQRKFLFYYLFAGFGAMLMHLGVWYFDVQTFSDTYYANYMADPRPYVLGASGAVYGIIAAFGYLFPNTKLMLIFPPIPIKARYFAIGLILIDAFLGVTGRSTGVAHFAHIGGAVAGVLLLLYWEKYGSKL